MDSFLNRLNKNLLYTIFSYFCQVEIQNKIIILSKKYYKASIDYLLLVGRIKIINPKFVSKTLNFPMLKKIKLNMDFFIPCEPVNLKDLIIIFSRTLFHDLVTISIICVVNALIFDLFI